MNSLTCLACYLLLVSFCAAQVPTGWPVLKTTDGKEYKDVKITLVEPSGIKVMHAAGFVRLSFLELPPEIRAQFNFNPNDAKEHEAKLEAARRENLRDQALQKAVDVTKDLLTVEEDKFTKELKIGFKKPVPVDELVELTAYYEGPWDDPYPLFKIYAQRTAREWSWLKYHSTHVLIDGSSWETKGRLNTEVFRGGKVYEGMPIPFTKEQVELFTKAKKVSIRIGTTEFDLTAAQRLPLSAVYARWVAEIERRKKP